MKRTIAAAFALMAMGAASPVMANDPAPEVRADTATRPPVGQWTDLFPTDGPVTRDWTVRHWYDVGEVPTRPVEWTVRNGVLFGPGETNTKDNKWVGTWLLSEHEYGDFVLEFDFTFLKGGYRGNGGVALRAPLKGDPAYDGMEIQITDERYERSMHDNVQNSQLTGSIYLINAPTQLMYKPGEWNRYKFDLRGSKVKIWLNDVLIQDVDMKDFTQPALMHEGDKLVPARPGAERPLRGHIGIQDLSDEGDTIMVANARIMPLD